MNNLSYIKRYNDSDFALPAPVVDLTFSNPLDSAKSQKINDVLLDSGADITQIPAKIARELDLISNERVEPFDYGKIGWNQINLPGTHHFWVSFLRGRCHGDQWQSVIGAQCLEFADRVFARP